MGMDVRGIGNRNANFRSNIWFWQPIYDIIEIVNHKYNLGIDNSRFDQNLGYGIIDPSKCKLLSKSIISYMDRHDEVRPGWRIFNYSGRITLLGPAFGRQHPLQDTPEKEIRNHVLSFCKFLDICDGFEIW